MALLWRGLIRATGDVSAMAAMQVAGLWLALWLLAFAVWKRSGSRGLSLAMLAVGLTPQAITFTGVVWKDVHMAYALLIVLGVALVAGGWTPGWVKSRWAALIVGVVLLAYAVLVRKNAVLAVVPMFILLIGSLWPHPGRRRWLAASGTLLVTLGVATMAVSRMAEPIRTRQYAQIPLDDLVHVLDPQEIRVAAEKAGASADFRDRLVATTEKCQKDDIPWDAFFNCYPRPPDFGRPWRFSAAQKDALVSMWVEQMPRHSVRYVEYRIRTFATLLFQGNLRYLTPETDDSTLRPANPDLGFAVKEYVTGLERDTAPIFQGWFWLGVSSVLALRRRWPGPWSRELKLLGASSVLYILGYMPTAPSANYRYLYWPALAGTTALVLVAVSYVLQRRTKPGRPTSSE
ncbi:hypothetical protein OG435_48535 [Streptomyces sp. NBC_01264]|nr:hypothetical protein [Streptomyces sp. NBC_01264]